MFLSMGEPSTQIEYERLAARVLSLTRMASQSQYVDIERKLLGDNYIVPALRGQYGVFALANIPSSTPVAIYEGTFPRLCYAC